MKHTLDYIISKPLDFKKCLECYAINWYENDTCVECNSKTFRKLSKSDLNNILIKDENELEIDT